MGCDIHPRAEVRINGIWRASLAELPHDRDYRTFAFLADVRNHDGWGITAMCEPRGLPEDTAWHRELNDDDLHSHSYFTLAELEANSAAWGMILMEKCHLLGELMAALAKLGPPEDVRLVFAFDN